MEKEEIKIGDRVLVRVFLSNAFHIHVKKIGRDIFGKYYLGEYSVDGDFGHYTDVSKFRDWNILYKD